MLILKIIWYVVVLGVVNAMITILTQKEGQSYWNAFFTNVAYVVIAVVIFVIAYFGLHALFPFAFN